ncbi:carboxypeptidase-like regulatory domain-containing protein [Hymenobacter sp. ASUV-10]|uniref:Carboxypeptidase-like regulatory domain-containing protein n=1 Tax=Hymenobacter aranciens TaxID=3063996 RepID=A0ABT9B9H2_9BACT|nr:carboxypeptidase-like regulatory domain-containing protein [Hymenobacter sp. ASUV-10]MDO7874848.1 carboxypeptidase-like regulatory domain-containing protein [Hymenobacter sp. ASUV-10]
MPQPQFSIPQPCAQPWAAMSPTAAGRHCATCATEVVDFTRLSNDEILAFLARRRGEHICINAHALQLMPTAPVPRWRQWLLAALAVLGLAPAASAVDHGGAALPPPLPPLADTGGRPPAPGQQVVVRGQVFDDQDKSPVAGARVMIDGTKYGVITDEQGRYELVMAASFEPLKKGTLKLTFSGSPFSFKPLTKVLTIARKPKPVELNVTLQSIDKRGQVMGRMMMPEPPVAPPRS